MKEGRWNVSRLQYQWIKFNQPLLMLLLMLSFLVLLLLLQILCDNMRYHYFSNPKIRLKYHSYFRTLLQYFEINNIKFIYFWRLFPHEVQIFVKGSKTQINICSMNPKCNRFCSKHLWNMSPVGWMSVLHINTRTC